MMRRLKLFLTLMICLALFSVFYAVRANDGIPDNCEYTNGAYYHANLFPRYEPQNQRLLLVDWATGAETAVLAEGLSATEFRIRGWSIDCHYLTAAAGHSENEVMLWDTMVWDMASNTLVGTFVGGRNIPHPITWDSTATKLLVETREGAYLWTLATGSRLQLTSTSDGNGRSFRPGSLEWDYPNNQLHAWLSIAPYGGVIYDLSSGALVGLSNRYGKALDTTTNNPLIANEPNDRPWCQPDENRDPDYYYYRWSYGVGVGPDQIRPSYQVYNRRLILMKAATREVVQVVEEGLETHEFTFLNYSPDCRYLAGGLGTRGEEHQLVVWDLSANPVRRVDTIPDALLQGFYVRWSPDSHYTIIHNRSEAYLWNLQTNTRVRLTADILSDCGISPIGCNGSPLYAYLGLSWKLESNQVTLGLTTGYLVTYDLTTGQAVSYATRDGQPVSDTQAVLIQGRIDSPHGCRQDVQYQTYNHRLVLKNWLTGELIQIVEHDLDLAGFRFLGCSPTLHHIAAALGTRDDMDTVIWDLTTNTRVGVFENAIGRPHRLDWSLWSNLLLIQTRSGAYIWNMDNDQRTLLSAEADPTGKNFIQHTWDAAHGWLLAVSVSSPNLVTAYDVQSGQVVTTFDNLTDRPVAFITPLSNGQLRVYNVREEDQLEFSIWDINSHTVLRLTTGRGSTPYGILFSPDARYVMSSSQIWDTHNLVGAEPHAPNFTVDLGSFVGYRFIDNNTIQTYDYNATRQQAARRLYTCTRRTFNLETGEQTERTDEYSYSSYINLAPCRA